MNRLLILSALALSVCFTAAATAATGAAQHHAPRPGALAGVQLPFIANQGQADPHIAFYAPTFAGTVAVTRSGELRYLLPARDGKSAAPLREHFVGGTAHPQGADAGSPVSYFIGSGAGRTVPSFHTLQLGEVFPGVQVALHAHGNNVEKIYTLAPGVDGGAVRMDVEGVESLRAAADGSLALATGAGELRLSAPIAWQEKNGRRLPVAVAYQVDGHRYGFRLGAHDATLPVIVDPLLQATYLGGDGRDVIRSILVHPGNGDVYVAGRIVHNDPALDLNFPLGEGGGGFAKAPPKAVDHFEFGFIARLSPDLAHHKQTTFFGSASRDSDIEQIVAHPKSKEIYAFGQGSWDDLPGIDDPYPEPAYREPTSFNGSFSFSKYFVSRFSEDLTKLGQTTYLPTNRAKVRRIALHPASGSLYAVGEFAGDLPGLRPGASYQAACKGTDAFLIKIDQALTQIQASTCFGGTRTDSGVDLAFHQGGDVYLLGTTASTKNTEFPPTDGGAQKDQGDRGSVSSDAFVARLGPNLNTLTNATFLGGEEADTAGAIAYDAVNDAVFVSGTTASAKFPQLAGGALEGPPSFGDSFLARLTGSLGSHTQSTLVSDREDDYRPLLHPNGDVYLLGAFSSLQGESRSSSNSGFRRFSPDLKTLREETYLTVEETPHSAVTAAISPRKNALTDQYEIYVAGIRPPTSPRSRRPRAVSRNCHGR